MKSDIDSGAPPPRPRKTTTGAAVSNAVGTMSLAQVEAELRRVLTTALPTQPLSELAHDDSPSIPSLISVWLISEVGDAVDESQLVKLKNVNKEDLRSLGGLARVVYDALQTLASTKVAS